MAPRAVLFRLLAGLITTAVVFFASFFIAIAARTTAGPSSKTSASPNAASEPAADTAGQTTVAPGREQASPDPSRVESTIPGTTTTTTTTTTTIALDPELPRLDIDSVFDGIHDQLASTVEVAVRLPAEFAADTTAWQPTFGSVTSSGYTVHIDNGASCNGASECRLATFTAQRSSQASPQLGSGTEVPLPNGLMGVLTDSSCGTDCDNGFITWIEAGVRYSVGGRATSGQAILDLAWRSIDRSLPTPAGPDICGPGAPRNGDRVARAISSELDDGRVMHWIAVCSVDGIQVELLGAPGDLRWVDIDSDGFADALIRHDDGSTTIFALDGNRPRAVIDTGGGRLVVSELRCADIDGDGEPEPYDAESGEELRFTSPIAVQRIDQDLSGATFVGC